MNERISLDAADLRLLRVLQRDASLSVADVAKAAAMSPTPAWRRLKRLREAGVIRRTVAVIDREAVGLDFVAYAFVKLALPSRENMMTFDGLVARWPEVVTCERITGNVDYLLKVIADDIRAYDAFLRLRLLDNTLVANVESRIVVATVKDTPDLPIRGG